MEQITYDVSTNLGGGGGGTKLCQIYLDDIVMFSKSFDEHVSHLSQVIDRIKSSGMKLSPKKIHLFRDKVKYVGHIISSKGIEADPGKINHVRNWPTPRTAAETRTFLGFSI